MDIPDASTARETALGKPIRNEKIVAAINEAINNGHLSVTVPNPKTCSAELAQLINRGYKITYNGGTGNQGLRGPPTQFPLDYETLSISW